MKNLKKNIRNSRIHTIMYNHIYIYFLVDFFAVDFFGVDLEAVLDLEAVDDFFAVDDDVDFLVDFFVVDDDVDFLVGFFVVDDLEATVFAEVDFLVVFFGAVKVAWQDWHSRSFLNGSDDIFNIEKMSHIGLS